MALGKRNVAAGSHGPKGGEAGEDGLGEQQKRERPGRALMASGVQPRAVDGTKAGAIGEAKEPAEHGA